MDEENTIPKEEVKSVEVQTLTESIEIFHKGLNEAVDELIKWKQKLSNLQETFVEKLKANTLSMKIK